MEIKGSFYLLSFVELLQRLSVTFHLIPPREKKIKHLREYLSSFVGYGPIGMPGYVLFQPLLSVGVGSNLKIWGKWAFSSRFLNRLWINCFYLNQIGLLWPVKYFFWICEIEKVNLKQNSNIRNRLTQAEKCKSALTSWNDIAYCIGTKLFHASLF